ncbi:MAG TPA: ABC transporter ATP-binding protein [Longimicrobiaceae bacterium]
MLQTIRKILDLFDGAGKWRLAWLFGVSVVAGLVQMLGVASILPFLALAANPSAVHSNSALNLVYTKLNFSSETAFLVAAGTAVFVMMALTNGVAALTTWLIHRFTYENYRSLSIRLLAKYIEQPYTFYLSRSTTGLTKNILAEVNAVVTGVLVPALRMMAKLVVTLLITALLVAIDPILALVSAGVLGGLYGAVYTVIRRRQLQLGVDRVEASSLRFKSAQEALIGIKEVKVLGREAEFVRRFSEASRTYASTQASNAAISELPTFALETVAFGGILLVVLYAFTRGGETATVLPTIGLYAFAAYKLKPALQTIFSSLAKIRFNNPSLDILHADLLGAGTSAGVQAEDPKPISLNRAIEIRGVYFRYPTSPDWVLRDVNLVIPKNSIVGFAGSTGAGKTTLVDVLLGLLEPQVGRVLVDDVEITSQNVRAWRRNIGYVPQHIFLMDKSVTENIAFGIPKSEIDQAAVEAAAAAANIHEFIRSLPDGYDTSAADRGLRLSGGQRQRIGIARALYHDPEILIFDEATSALDSVTEDAVMQAINNLAHRKTILLIAHRLTTLRECDTIFFFENGRIVDQGTFAELTMRNRTFQEMARLSVSIIEPDPQLPEESPSRAFVQ